MTKSSRHLRSFEALQIALATEEAKRMPTTPEMERQVESLYAAGRRRMAQIRYAEHALRPAALVDSEIRPEILAMTRADVITQLGELRARHPQMQYAHRDGEALNDHDHRAKLEDAMELVGDTE